MRIYYSTRYALSAGIREMQGEPAHNPKLIRLHGSNSLGRLDKDTFELRYAAVAAAEAMRQKRIKSLNKALDALYVLRFE